MEKKRRNRNRKLRRNLKRSKILKRRMSETETRGKEE